MCAGYSVYGCRCHGHFSPAIAYLLVSPNAIAGSAGTKRPSILPLLWFVILGVAIALLVGMAFLVVAETFVPSGSLPGPVYLARGLRSRLGRSRRYSQIGRILVRRGLLPYLRADTGRSFAPRMAAPASPTLSGWRSKTAA